MCGSREHQEDLDLPGRCVHCGAPMQARPAPVTPRDPGGTFVRNGRSFEPVFETDDAKADAFLDREEDEERSYGVKARLNNALAPRRGE